MITHEITSGNEMTGGQRKQLVRFVTDALHATKENVESIVDGLNLDNVEAQEIIEKGKLKELLQTAVIGLLKQHAIIDERFGAPIVEFDFTVPVNYDHDTQIDSSGKNAKNVPSPSYYYNDDLTSKNFANATNKLEPGKTYTVKIFPILTTVDSDSCVNFLRKQNAILVGGQGTTLVYDLAKEQLPKNKSTVSFDKKDALWKDSDGRHRVPFVKADSGGGFEFGLGHFGRGWDSGHCLLCVCDKKKPLEA